MDDDVGFRRRSLRVNFPPQIFFRAYPSPETDTSITVSTYLANHFTTFTPLTRAVPHHIHITHLLSRDAISDDVVMRVQSLVSNSGSLSPPAAASGSRKKLWRRDLSKLLAPVYGVTEFHGSTLTYNHPTPIMNRLAYGYAEKGDEKQWMAAAAAAAGASESQNTEEEGVFLSQAAMEKLKADAARAAPGSRQLLALPSALSTSTSLIEIGPSQFRAYVFRLSPRSVIGSGGGAPGGGALPSPSPLPPIPSPLPPVATPIGAGSMGAAVGPIVPPAPLPGLNVPAAPGAAPLPPAAGAAAGMISTEWKVRNSHSHSIDPEQNLPYWPERTELVVILLLTLGVVVYYLVALGIAHCTPSSPLSPQQKQALTGTDRHTV